MKWIGVRKQKEESNLYEMARRLHLERRLHPRVRLPQLSPTFLGPNVKFESHNVPIGDISEGGVCLIDDHDLFRSQMGQSFILKFECDKKFDIKAKLVATNLNKKHIQFENPPSEFSDALRPWISLGLRGIWMKSMAELPIQYKTFLTSVLNDSLISATDPRWDFELCVRNEEFCISNKNWPTYKTNGRAISALEFDQILLFLANIEPLQFEDHRNLMKNLISIRGENEP